MRHIAMAACITRIAEKYSDSVQGQVFTPAVREQLQRFLTEKSL